jgi:uncharacterized protein (TIGR03000 family)
MIRTTAALALVLALTASAWAQLIVRPPPDRPQPAGVILPPTLPIVGSNTAPSPTSPARVRPRPYLIANPFYDLWGYAPLWPVYYDNPPSAGTGLIPLPVRTEVTVVNVEPTAPAAPAAPAPSRARLTLTIPPNAQVSVGGQPVDVAAIPLALESPDLEPGQRYTFDLKVTWKERSGVQERKRTVTVAAGQSTSLTYTAAEPVGTAVRLQPR